MHLDGLAASLTAMTAALDRLTVAVANGEPSPAVALAADSLALASAAPAKISAEVLLAAYRTPPATPAQRPPLALVPGGA